MFISDYFLEFFCLLLKYSKIAIPDKDAAAVPVKNADPLWIPVFGVVVLRNVIAFTT